MTAWIADVLIVLGLIVITVGVYGIVRFPTSTRGCTPRARRPFRESPSCWLPPPLVVGRRLSPASC
jgi:hypothetical protein